VNKKLLVILGILILLSIEIVLSVRNNEDEEKNEASIPVYDADVVCSLSGVDTFEDMNEEYDIKAYLTIKDDLVTKVILVGISSDSGNLYETQSLMNDYNQIEGIEAKVSSNNNDLITEIEYNYDVIDLEEVRSKLGYLLIDDSIFLKADSLPVSLSDYKKYELRDYVCN